MPNGGHLRPFGYEKDRRTVIESEAEILRQIVARFLSGESSRSICVWLNDQNVLTSAGGQWQTMTLNAMLKSARIAGLREHKGTVVAEAVWDPIITPDQRERVLGHFATKKLNNTRSPRRYVLSGLLRCGKCGNKLYSAVCVDTRRYVCASGPDHGGCGGITVVAPPLEEFLSAAVLMRLDTPAMADTLAGRRAADEQHSALLNELEGDRQQMQELSGMWAAKEISSAEWKAARVPIEARIVRSERQLAQLTDASTLDGLIGTGQQLQDNWATMNLDRQAAIIKAVLDYATILPGTPGSRSLDPARIQPVWRLWGRGGTPAAGASVRSGRGPQKDADTGDNTGISCPDGDTLSSAASLDPCRKLLLVKHHAPHFAQIAGAPAQSSTSAEDHCVSGGPFRYSEACARTSVGDTPLSESLAG
jgi:site-specific DNA recombinase